MTLPKALERLTDRQRTLIRLRDHEKLTWAKIGEALGITHGYALKLHKGAVKMLAYWESVDERHLIDSKDLAGKWSWKEGQASDARALRFDRVEELPATDPQTPPQAHPAPVYSTPEEKVLRATDNSFLNEGGSFKAPEPALEIPQVSPQRKPLVAIATATSKPKVKWVTGVPMVLPKQGPVSVTIRS